jgi:regulatory LuxR family protein
MPERSEATGPCCRGIAPHNLSLSGVESLHKNPLAPAAIALSNKEIARRLKVTEGTAKCHLHHIYRKLGIDNRTALAALVFQSSTRRRA